MSVEIAEKNMSVNIAEENMSVTSNSKKIELDKPTWVISAVVLLISLAYCAFQPEQAKESFLAIRSWVIYKWDWFFLVFGAVSLFLVFYWAFGRYGGIVIGNDGEKPKYSLMSWGGMLFCAGVGSSILYWPIAEVVYYSSAPPFGLEAASKEAYRISVPYSIFHWGLTPWAMFAVPSLPVAWYYHRRGGHNLKISQVLADLIGQKMADGPMGRLLDVLIVFSTFAALAIPLGLGVPVLTGFICTYTGMENTLGLQILVLILWSSLFIASVFRGLDKGIKILSDWNQWVVYAMLIFILLTGPTLFILQNTVDSIGVLLDNFIIMSLGGNPIQGWSFDADWTVFYYAYYLVYTPYMMIFIAAISRGRTVKQFLLGLTFAGTLGCSIFFWIISSAAIDAQMTGALDLVAVNKAQGMAATVVAFYSSLPLSKVVLLFLIVGYFIFLATSVDSGAYAMACVTSKEIRPGQQPERWNRIVWAIMVALLGVAIIRIGGLASIQTLAIAMGLPIAFLCILLYWQQGKWFKEYSDNQKANGLT